MASHRHVDQNLLLDYIRSAFWRRLQHIDAYVEAETAPVLTDAGRLPRLLQCVYGAQAT